MHQICFDTNLVNIASIAYTLNSLATLYIKPDWGHYSTSACRCTFVKQPAGTYKLPNYLLPQLLLL